MEKLPRVADTYRRFVADLPTALDGDVREARDAIGGLVGGTIRLSPAAKGKALIGEYGLSREALVFACLGRRGRAASNASPIPSRQKCYLCLRYKPLPM